EEDAREDPLVPSPRCGLDREVAVRARQTPQRHDASDHAYGRRREAALRVEPAELRPVQGAERRVDQLRAFVQVEMQLREAEVDARGLEPLGRARGLPRAEAAGRVTVKHLP